MRRCAFSTKNNTTGTSDLTASARRPSFFVSASKIAVAPPLFPCFSLDPNSDVMADDSCTRIIGPKTMVRSRISKFRFRPAPHNEMRRPQCGRRENTFIYMLLFSPRQSPSKLDSALGLTKRSSTITYARSVHNGRNRNRVPSTRTKRDRDRTSGDCWRH